MCVCSMVACHKRGGGREGVWNGVGVGVEGVWRGASDTSENMNYGNLVVVVNVQC